MTEDNEKKYYLVELRSNYPKEMEVKAEDKEEAGKMAQERLERLNEVKFPDFSVGRVTESGVDKGIVWRE